MNQPTKYRKKPVEAEAWLVTEENIGEVKDFLQRKYGDRAPSWIMGKAVLLYEKGWAWLSLTELEQTYEKVEEQS